MGVEQWRGVEGFPDYEISDQGRVRRVTSRTCAKAGTILKTPPRSASRPYPAVDLCGPGKRKTFAVHRLVAVAFLGPAPEGCPEVNHKNGQIDDNRAENLEWTTRSENELHAYRTGLACAKGERNGQAKLTAAKVQEIRAKATGRHGEKAALARAYEVSEATIRAVLTGRAWA